MPIQLHDAVERAYQVFGAYRPGPSLFVCDCPVCMSKDCEQQLRTGDLRELKAGLLFEYNNSCHDRRAPQAIDEFRYFLPRYFELIADQDCDELYPDH